VERSFHCSDLFGGLFFECSTYEKVQIIKAEKTGYSKASLNLNYDLDEFIENFLY
jgi:hypothetical protein